MPQIHEGRAEIFYNGKWGTICDHAWDKDDADVFCQQLGYKRAVQAYRGASHGQGADPIWMDDVACSGSEAHMHECKHRGWGNHDCTHRQDASVRCAHDSSVVRLAAGGLHFGRVEVKVNGHWGTVCDKNWDMTDAEVVCRELGFTGAVNAPHSSTFGASSGPIWMDDVHCGGGESSLLNCGHRGWGIHNCDRSNEASVVCSI